MSDSVGLNGKNKPEDVKLVKKKLKELGYPIKDDLETLSSEDIKAIKFFQVAIKKLPEKYGTVLTPEIKFPDGLISKGYNTEKVLFSDKPLKYKPPNNGDKKNISSKVKKKVEDATGNNKKVWDKIVEVWDNVSPYLSNGSYMSSGYRTKEEQRQIVYQMYNNDYAQTIRIKFGTPAWQKYKDMQGVNNDEADPEMCRMIKESTGQAIAVPGRSRHQSGKAIDIGGSEDKKQALSLLWCNVEFEDKKLVTKILLERNGCVHFEFD